MNHQSDCGRVESVKCIAYGWDGDLDLANVLHSNLLTNGHYHYLLVLFSYCSTLGFRPGFYFHFAFHFAACMTPRCGCYCFLRFLI